MNDLTNSTVCINGGKDRMVTNTMVSISRHTVENHGKT
uniref:Uncharacterized protein n=1 Tax=Arundo donax TaxID=35708 RepID=A0A0A9BAW4_ARUDO